MGSFSCLFCKPIARENACSELGNTPWFSKDFFPGLNIRACDCHLHSISKHSLITWSCSVTWCWHGAFIWVFRLEAFGLAFIWFYLGFQVFFSYPPEWSCVFFKVVYSFFLQVLSYELQWCNRCWLIMSFIVFLFHSSYNCSILFVI